MSEAMSAFGWKILSLTRLGILVDCHYYVSSPQQAAAPQEPCGHKARNTCSNQRVEADSSPESGVRMGVGVATVAVEPVDTLLSDF